jgi:hypothetical protein
VSRETTVATGVQYRVRDFIQGVPYTQQFGSGTRYMAMWTGDFRPPKKGEWFLSGALIEAYRANADMSEPYHIAVIVETERVVTVKVVRECWELSR